MTAIAKDRNTTQRPGLYIAIALAASATIYAGTLVCYDSSGDLVNGANTSGYSFAGVAMEGVDNSAGAAGDESAEVWVDGQFLFTSASLTGAKVGEEVFLVDNATVGLRSTAALATAGRWIKVGRIAEVVSATSCWVRIEPANRPETKQYTIQIAGVNATTFSFASVAAAFGGSNFYIAAVQAVVSYVTADGSLDGLKAVTTDYTLASGVLSAVGDESLNTWLVTFTGQLY